MPTARRNRLLLVSPTQRLALASGAALVASLAPVKVAWGQTLSWNDPNGGSASDVTNWTPNGLPTSSSLLLFNVNSALASIPLTFDATATKSGTMTFRKEAYGVTMTSPHATTSGVVIAPTTGDNATVVLEAGSWSLFNTLANVNIANDSGTVGVFTINGSDAEFIGDNGTTLGNVGTGTLNVLSGGRYVTQTMTLGLGNTSGSGTVNVAGQTLAPFFTRSRLECLQSLTVGSLGTGVLNVSNGALLTVQALLVGTAATGSGTVTIGGKVIADATVQASLSATIGGSSNGTIHVNADGRLDVNSTLTVQGTGAGVGTLHINPGGAVTAGNLTVTGNGVLDLDGGTLDVSGTTFTYANPASHLVLGAPGGPVVTLKDNVACTLGV